MRRHHAENDFERSIEYREEQERLERLERKKALAKSKYTSLIDMIGSCKGLDTMEAYFERKQADKAHETRQEQGYV
jgi:excinuclease UvrABC nuclease subunit